MLIYLPDGTKVFRAVVNGEYTVSENGRNSPLIANRNVIRGAWQAFDVINVIIKNITWLIKI